MGIQTQHSYIYMPQYNQMQHIQANAKYEFETNMLHQIGHYMSQKISEGHIWGMYVPHMKTLPSTKWPSALYTDNIYYFIMIVYSAIRYPCQGKVMSWGLTNTGQSIYSIGRCQDMPVNVR